MGDAANESALVKGRQESLSQKDRSARRRGINSPMSAVEKAGGMQSCHRPDGSP